MTPKRHTSFFVYVFIIASIAFVAVTVANAKRPIPPHPGYPPVGIYVDLTEEFHHALKGDDYGGSTTLSTDMSREYLHQIAIATRYTVETNIELLKQQARIIELLEAQQKAGKGTSSP